MLFVLISVVLLAPPLVIAGFWWSSVRRQRAAHKLPDGEAIVLARVSGIACALLPMVQLVASIVRYKTGEMGTFLWYLVPGFGIVLAVGALASFLANARGTERLLSSAMVLLSTCMLVLLTLLAGKTNG